MMTFNVKYSSTAVREIIFHDQLKIDNVFTNNDDQNSKFIFRVCLIIVRNSFYMTRLQLFLKDKYKRSIRVYSILRFGQDFLENIFS